MPDMARSDDENYIIEYSNHVCQVGDFIIPAQALGIVGDVVQIRTQYAIDQWLSEPLSSPYILDIDIDFRAPGLEHLQKRDELVARLMRGAHAVTIATSPYFIDQQVAIDLLKVIIHNYRQDHSNRYR